jgi:hypothetical protein
MLKRFISTSVLVVLVLAGASGADAFTSDKRTYFTFNQSVTLPGVTLPAGTYMFRLADPDTTRRVIQVSDKDGTQSYAMLLTIPAHRPDPAKDSEIRFLETPAGAPRAVNAWWYLGDSTGYQFMYSKRQLDELNRIAAPEPAGLSEAVPPIDERGSPGVVDGEGVPSVDERIEEQARAEQAPPAAQAPAQQPVAEPAPEPVSAPAREELPETASPFGLLLLGGLASGALGLRLLRKS